MNESSNLEASVMVLHERATDSLILTKRTNQLRTHPGDVCFPGGRRDASDTSLYDTALRELYEELGIHSSRIQLEKKLMMESTLTGYHIQPWYAHIDSLAPFIINSTEVAQVLRIAMSDVCNKASYRQILVQRPGITIKSWQFIHSIDFIWGATVRIMMQFCR